MSPKTATVIDVGSCEFTHMQRVNEVLEGCLHGVKQPSPHTELVFDWASVLYDVCVCVCVCAM